MKGNLDFFAMNSTLYGNSMACVIRMGGNISEYLKSIFRRNLFWDFSSYVCGTICDCSAQSTEGPAFL